MDIHEKNERSAEVPEVCLFSLRLNPHIMYDACLIMHSCFQSELHM